MNSKIRILNKWNKIKEDFELDTQIVTCSSFLESYGINAAYLSSLDAIVLHNKQFTQKNAMYLLHETCHAIQEKENRLIKNKRNTRQIYANELEAEFFAFNQYENYFRKDLGKNKCSWRLAHYKAYRLSQSRKHKIPALPPMTTTEVSKFIMNLDTDYKQMLIEIMNN